MRDIFDTSDCPKILVKKAAELSNESKETTITSVFADSNAEEEETSSVYSLKVATPELRKPVSEGLKIRISM